MNNYLISEELGNKVLAYLGTRPYVEVSGLVEEMKALVRADVVNPVAPVQPGTEGQSEPVPATPDVKPDEVPTDEASPTPEPAAN